MDSLRQGIMRKVIWRLVPFTMGLYVINIMDRVNIGYAALRMNKDLGIAPAAFGALAAAFFIGYFFFEVPSNMILERVGSRKWIARIMVSWGIATGLVFFAQAYWQIYALRLILGIMEAGFFPGIIFYFTLWFPTKERALVTSLFSWGPTSAS
jgi:ACS family tartrate transporter-like MFS transporter